MPYIGERASVLAYASRSIATLARPACIDVGACDREVKVLSERGRGCFGTRRRTMNRVLWHGFAWRCMELRRQQMQCGFGSTSTPLNRRARSLLRDIWLIICDYIVPVNPIPLSLRCKVAEWYMFVAHGKKGSLSSADNEQGLHMCTHAISLRNWFAPLVARSKLYTKLHRFNEALIDADSAFDLAPINQEWSVFHAKGEALFGLGHYKSASHYLKIALPGSSGFKAEPHIRERIHEIDTMTLPDSTHSADSAADANSSTNKSQKRRKSKTDANPSRIQTRKRRRRI